MRVKAFLPYNPRILERTHTYTYGFQRWLGDQWTIHKENVFFVGQTELFIYLSTVAIDDWDILQLFAKFTHSSNGFFR